MKAQQCWSQHEWTADALGDRGSYWLRVCVKYSEEGCQECTHKNARG